MTYPTIGCVIATPGRRSLLRTMYSILYQGVEEGDDVLIVGDGYHEPTAKLVELMGPPFRYVATEKTRDWGHSQQNYGLKHVRGDWLLLQDDDDVFLPRAFDEARAVIRKLESPRPVIGRVITPYLGILWRAPKTEPLDGHCLLVPNDKEKLGYFGTEYAGDQMWLSSNLGAYDVYSWADRIWTLTRPEMKLWPVLTRREQSRNGKEWVLEYSFLRDDDGAPAGKPVAHLYMFRDTEVDRKNDDWHGGFRFFDIMADDEFLEVVQFASWAAQGSDLVIQADRRADDRRLHAALKAAWFTEHANTPDYIEYVHQWPPHRFVPPEKKEEKSDQTA